MKKLETVSFPEVPNPYHRVVRFKIPMHIPADRFLVAPGASVRADSGPLRRLFKRWYIRGFFDSRYEQASRQGAAEVLRALLRRANGPVTRKRLLAWIESVEIALPQSVLPKTRKVRP